MFVQHRHDSSSVGSGSTTTVHTVRSSLWDAPTESGQWCFLRGPFLSHMISMHTTTIYTVCAIRPDWACEAVHPSSIEPCLCNSATPLLSLTVNYMFRHPRTRTNWGESLVLSAQQGADWPRETPQRHSAGQSEGCNAKQSSLCTCGSPSTVTACPCISSSIWSRMQNIFFSISVLQYQCVWF